MNDFHKTEKVKYLLPGDKEGLDTTVKFVYVGSAILTGIFVFVVMMSFILLFTFVNIPGFPIPKNNQTPVFHVMGFWKLLLGYVHPIFKTASYNQYATWVLHLKETGESGLLFWRWVIAFFGGFSCAIFMFLKALTPTGGDKHIKGKVLLKGKKAYEDLKREFNFLSKDGRGSGLVIAGDEKFDPTIQTIKTLKPGTYIELPEDNSRTHSMYMGGTGRGKTQLIKYHKVAQIYAKIRGGEAIKLMIADTPKSDYDTYFHSTDVYRINPTEQGGFAWNISEDLTDALLANAFWEGKIPANDADPIWSNAAIAVATGCTRFLQVVAPKGWNYAMLAHMLTKSGEELEPILTEHYPEAKQVLNAAGETLTSVMFNLGTYTVDLIALGRIYDGFDIKKPVKQATAKALKNNEYVEFIYQEMARGHTEGNTASENMTRAIMFKGVCKYLTATNPTWTWKNFVEIIEQPRHFQSALVIPYLDPEREAKVIDGIQFPAYWKQLATVIIQRAKEWDKIESAEKLSIRDWIMDDSPARKILILKPSETYPTLTEGLIKGILYYSNSVILGRLQDDSKRKFHILIDELQSYGNIKKFIGPALSLYRSRGVQLCLAFQDLAQLVELYEQTFVDFMNSNIGSFFILGVNNGFTANKLTELVGDKKIQRKHKHSGADGAGNVDLQEHEEKVVYGNEWNLLGSNKATMNIKYMYLVGGLNPAYVLDAPIIPYKTRHTPKVAKWITEPGHKPVKPVDIDEMWGMGKGKSSAGRSTEELTLNEIIAKKNATESSLVQ